MNNDRRSFMQKVGILAAALPFGSSAEKLMPARESGNDHTRARNAGMKFCEAYFWGAKADLRKIELAKQMDVLGAVGKINPAEVGLPSVSPWEYEAVLAVKNSWEKLGLKLEVVEGPPALSEITKLGLPEKDKEIANFITLMKNLTKVGINTICYNWMPVIDWSRTTTDKPGRGGALVTAFNSADIKDNSLTQYGKVSKETLWKNLEYFLKAVIPEAEKCGMKLAMHPDDPPVDEIRGISRIMNTVDSFRKLVDICPSASNGITMCQANFTLLCDDLSLVIKEFGKRNLIHFVHFRNVRGTKSNFEETFHDEGLIDMHKAMKAYFEIGFQGPIRNDHVPTMAGDSNEHPGYSTIGTLFATGYTKGLMEAISKSAITPIQSSEPKGSSTAPARITAVAAIMGGIGFHLSEANYLRISGYTLSGKRIESLRREGYFHKGSHRIMLNRTEPAASAIVLKVSGDGVHFNRKINLLWK